MVKGGRNTWILTQNEERLLATEPMGKARVVAPGTDQPGYVLLLNRRTGQKRHVSGLYCRKEWAKKALQAIPEKQSNYISYTGGTDLVTGRHQPTFTAILSRTYVMSEDE